MNPLEAFLMAAQGLFANKLRSALTVLGIIIGVGAVISLMSVGRGSQAAVTSGIESMGTNLLFVRPGASSQGGVRGAQGSAATLTLEDAEAIADPFAAPSVAMVAPQMSTFGQAVAGSENTFTQIYGVTPEYEQVRNFPVAEGQFITQHDVDARSMVVVLGSNVAETLFPDQSALGQHVTISNRRFTVTGVLKSKGGTGLGMEDVVVLVPITTMQYRLASQRTVAGRSTVNLIYVQVTNSKQIDAATEQISSILRERHRITSEDDFTITSQQETIEALNETTGVFTMFLGAIAGISLLVGGIGIMNIMLVSVAERTREIGIRKAVGAKRRDVLMQFLIEATMLSLIGGVVGLLAGWGLSRVAPQLHQALSGQTIQAVVSSDIVLLAFGVSVAIGLFFGIYPASRAARLNPIEALRHE